LLTFLRRQLKSYCAQVLDSKRHHLSTGAVRCQKSQQRSACICSDRAPGRASALPRVRRHRAGCHELQRSDAVYAARRVPQLHGVAPGVDIPADSVRPVRAAPHR
jgi:hypothetical protein